MGIGATELSREVSDFMDGDINQVGKRRRVWGVGCNNINM